MTGARVSAGSERRSANPSSCPSWTSRMIMSTRSLARTRAILLSIGGGAHSEVPLGQERTDDLAHRGIVIDDKYVLLQHQTSARVSADGRHTPSQTDVRPPSFVPLQRSGGMTLRPTNPFVAACRAEFQWRAAGCRGPLSGRPWPALPCCGLWLSTAMWGGRAPSPSSPSRPRKSPTRPGWRWAPDCFGTLASRETSASPARPATTSRGAAMTGACGAAAATVGRSPSTRQPCSTPR